MRSRQGNKSCPTRTQALHPLVQRRQPSFLMSGWGRVRHEKQEHKAPAIGSNPALKPGSALTMRKYRRETTMSFSDGLAGQS